MHLQNCVGIEESLGLLRVHLHNYVGIKESLAGLCRGHMAEVVRH